MMSTAAYAGGGLGGWCVLIYGEGMLMRKGGRGRGGVVCRQEVLCLYLRHVIKCALIVKIFTGRKVKMPKAGENLRHIIKSSVEKVLENYSSAHTDKYRRNQQLL